MLKGKKTVHGKLGDDDNIINYIESWEGEICTYIYVIIIMNIELFLGIMILKPFICVDICLRTRGFFFEIIKILNCILLSTMRISI